MPEILKSAVEKVKSLAQLWQGTRIARALRRYGLANGSLLCGGITYRAIFSLFAAIALAFTVFVRVLGDDDTLKNQVIESVNTAVPGLIATGDQNGILPVDKLVLSTSMNITSVIAIAVLLWSVITAIESVRTSVRVMFSLPPNGQRQIADKLRSLAAFGCVVVGVLISSIAGIAANTFGHYIENWIDLGTVGSAFLTFGSLLITAVFDALVFVMIVRLLAGVKARPRDLWIGAGIAAVGFSVIRYLGTSVVVGSAARNPLFATGAVLITVLIWLYLCARILLTAAAFTANPPLSLLEQLDDEDHAKQQVLEHKQLSGSPGAKPQDITQVQRQLAERDRRARSFAWKTAIGASAVGYALGARLGRGRHSDR